MKTVETKTASGQPSPRLWNTLLGLSLLLVLAGLYAFYAASTRPRKAPRPVAQEVRVEIRDGTCHPADITLPAGRTRFVIVNQTQRALEWEILDGVMVVDERENITPGMTQSLTLRLQPGEFQITCGLLSNPRGRLLVLPTAESEQRARAPQMVDFIGVLAEYRVYSLLRLGELNDGLAQLQAATQNGDVRQAAVFLRQIYAGYASLAPVVQSFADLDARLDVRADVLAQRELDPGYTGWRSLAATLAQPASAERDARVTALLEQVNADLAQLEQRVRSLELTPQRMLQASALAWRRQASYATATVAPALDETSDVAGLSEARLDGAYQLGLAEGTREVVQLLRAVITTEPEQLWQAIEQALQPWPSEAAQALLTSTPDAQALPGAASSPLQDRSQNHLLQVAQALEQALERVNPDVEHP